LEVTGRVEIFRIFMFKILAPQHRPSMDNPKSPPIVVEPPAPSYVPPPPSAGIIKKFHF